VTTGIRWEQIADRSLLPRAELQAFTCTTEHPRTPEGRRLPHPRPWEWEVQAHLRQAGRCFRPGDLALVGREIVGGRLACAAHLQPSSGTALVEVFIASVAVEVSHRGRGGDVADQAFTEVSRLALAEALTTEGFRLQ
jgi:hypothetical protein